MPQHEIEVTTEGFKWQTAVSEARTAGRHTYLTQHRLRVAVIAPLTPDGTPAPDPATDPASVLLDFVKHIAGMATDAERVADHPGGAWTEVREEDTGTLDRLIEQARGIAGQP